MSEPTTEAGKALDLRLVGPQRDYHRYGEAIAQVEAEAAEHALSAAREAVIELGTLWDGGDQLVFRAQVLRILGEPHDD